MNRNILFGCIADDFTGAGDAASYLAGEGIQTVLCNGIPTLKTDLPAECEAVVIALKIRSCSPEKAVKSALGALQWLTDCGTGTIYYKYCSTFDSTAKGNIGPVLDALLDKMGQRYTVLCPSMLENQRVVLNGQLLVDGVPLHQSSMKDHPLNPMWDSDLCRLMSAQSIYPCFHITGRQLELEPEVLKEQIESFGLSHPRFYLVPDYADERQGDRCSLHFSGLKLLSGGSGFLKPLAKRYGCSSPDKNYSSWKTSGRAILLSGSCSVATRQQIAAYIKTKKAAYCIDAESLMKGDQTVESVWRDVERNAFRNVLLYSGGKAGIGASDGFTNEDISNAFERFFAKLAKKAEENSFRIIITAGGETSGSVIRELGFDAFRIGPSVAPGVPVISPLYREDIKLVLKSGNFGQEDFFDRALKTVRGEKHESATAGK